MFKFITLSCLLAASVQCKISPNQAVPYYPQPYPAAYPQGYPQTYPQAYPQFYAAQPKYSVQPAYVAAAVPYSAPGSYRQVFVPASPAYNPYYHGYAPFPAYPQAHPYPYAYAQNEEPQTAGAQPEGWGQYLSNSFWNYVPNFPYITGSQSASEGSSESSATSSSAESSATASENTSPGKGDKPAAAEVPKSEQLASDVQQPAQAAVKQFAAYPLPYFGQPQFLPYQQVAYDPAKLNAANNGAVSSFLFPRNQNPSVFQQPQPFADQKYYQAPQSNQGTAALAYQRYLQYQKQPLQGQYQPGQFQQGQFQQQQQDQQFQQQQPESFQQQYEQQAQKDESSVVVESNVTGAQVNAEGQQQPQSKLATGPTIAVAKPQGTAFAGIGGRAEAEPISTAIVGNNATAISGPSATAISLDAQPTINLTPVHKLTTAYVAKYAPELGVYRVAEIRTIL